MDQQLPCGNASSKMFEIAKLQAEIFSLSSNNWFSGILQRKKIKNPSVEWMTDCNDALQ
jgi:hypothetical protein